MGKFFKKKENRHPVPEDIRKDEKRARIRARIRAFHFGQQKKKLKYVYLAIAVLLLDQLSKWYIMERVIRPLYDGRRVRASVFRLVS